MDTSNHNVCFCWAARHILNWLKLLINYQLLFSCYYQLYLGLLSAFCSTAGNNREHERGIANGNKELNLILFDWKIASIRLFQINAKINQSLLQVQSCHSIFSIWLLGAITRMLDSLMLIHSTFWSISSRVVELKCLTGYSLKMGGLIIPRSTILPICLFYRTLMCMCIVVTKSRWQIIASNELVTRWVKMRCTLCLCVF